MKSETPDGQTLIDRLCTASVNARANAQCGAITCSVQGLEYLADLLNEAAVAQSRAEDAATLRQQLAEAQAIVADVNNSVFGSRGYFTTPSCVEAVESLKMESNRLRAQLATAVQALTLARVHLLNEGIYPITVKIIDAALQGVRKETSK